MPEYIHLKIKHLELDMPNFFFKTQVIHTAYFDPELGWRRGIEEF